MVKISQLALSLCFAAASVNAFTFVPQTPAYSRSICNNRQKTTYTDLFMASTLSRLPDSAVEVTITAPGDSTKAAYDKALNELSKKVTVPGFRKGSKIPPAILENALAQKIQGGKNTIKIQAINDLVNALIEPALKEEHGLDPIGQPSLKAQAEELAETFKPGDDLEFVVKCDVWPDVKFVTDKGDKPYVGLKGSYKRKPFNQAKFDKALGDLREKYATQTPIEDSSHKLGMGDACVVNMVGYMGTGDDGKTKGEPLPDAASGDNVEVILGEGRYMDGLVEGLEGASVGETVQVYVTFPPNLKNKALAGKAAVFDVTVESASKRVVPELTEELAEKIRPGMSVQQLKDELLKAVDEEDAKEFVNERNVALSSSLAEVMDIEVPDTLVTNQAREKYAIMMTEFRDQGTSDEEIKRLISPENFLKYKDIYAPDIKRDFKVNLAIDEIAKLEGIEVPSYQIEEQLANLKQEAESNGDEFDESVVRSRVESTLISRYVFDFLADNGDLEVEYVEDKFDEKMMTELAQQSMERDGIDAKLEDAPVDAVIEEEPEVEKGEPEPETEAVVEEEPEVEAVIEEEPEPEPESPSEPEPEPVVAEATLSEEDKAAKYASIEDEGERAYEILKDLGMVEVIPDDDE
eukprot:CAMPEP_0178958852 /NCGR_PEP_ID=MMETSP0789-20121207/11896_1 /TAXON_ID=3005 /ORGANISM="Rhizosolenia setigera, Strain CCMP 1694" /LENGTH=634 /DNA_ID=CAMNT_0020641651 /DNA_START=148 /DNA_END=2052 /DNA_ORIENTATION=+